MPKDEWKIVENTHPPIIDRAVFEKVGMLIESRKSTRSRTYDYLLKGIIICHECQHPLAVMNRPNAKGEDCLFFVCRTYQRFTKYERCTCHSIKEETVTNAVMEQVASICKQYLHYLDYNELANEAQEMYLRERQQQEKDVILLKQKLETVIAKIDKVYDDRLSNIIDDEVYKRAYERLKEEQNTLQHKIKALEDDDSNSEVFDQRRIRQLVERFLNAKEYSRELIVSLIDRVELTENKEVIIFFKFKELEMFSHL